MAEIPISNHGKETRFVAGRLIPPGETRIIDERLLPPSERPPASPEEPPAAPDVIRDLLAGDVRRIKDGLGDISDAELARLAAAEEAGKHRRTVLAAVTHERFSRADAKANEHDAGPAD